MGVLTSLAYGAPLCVHHQRPLQACFALVPEFTWHLVQAALTLRCWCRAGPGLLELAGAGWSCMACCGLLTLLRQQWGGTLGCAAQRPLSPEPSPGKPVAVAASDAATSSRSVHLCAGFAMLCCAGILHGGGAVVQVGIGPCFKQLAIDGGHVHRAEAAGAGGGAAAVAAADVKCQESIRALGAWVVGVHAAFFHSCNNL